jgi:acyl-CoA reductase-like NAD-dependent aldehyde dehydrogenase
MNDQLTLRDRIRRLLAEADGFSYDCLEPHDYQRHADAMIALPEVLSAPVDRAAVLREAADAVQAHPGAIPYRPQLDEDGGFWWDTRDRDAAADLLRRMADEAQQPEETGR